MSMSRKDYNALAEAIRYSNFNDTQKKEIAKLIASGCKAGGNSNIDTNRFIEAATK